ncbi:hypothetical protein M514_05346 [Trichuris suis]|uniref:Uncharacterized protein n=1 Tax=Trichuris suis TaxID=68888 RepID=A0A085NQ87_9BILA|nr:hypothetical protein M513_05346 [Trichuris suis]KFD71633.1 hypothetical protein M514_05346 [Trichuris suis]
MPKASLILKNGHTCSKCRQSRSCAAQVPPTVYVQVADNAADTSPGKSESRQTLEVLKLVAGRILVSLAQSVNVSNIVR